MFLIHLRYLMFYGFALWFQYDTDFFILDKFPLSVRPFYTMPDPENEVSLFVTSPSARYLHRKVEGMILYFIFWQILLWHIPLNFSFQLVL